MNEEMVDAFHQFNLKIKPPYHKFVWAIIKSIGWYLVGIAIILIYTWPYVSKKWNSFKNKKNKRDYDVKYHKNIDLSSKLLIAMQLAREKMQEKYLKDRAIAFQKEEEKREKKSLKLFNLVIQDHYGYRLNNGQLESARSSPSLKSSKLSLKNDYNPLMSSSGGRYIPPKRSCCGQGSCG